MINPPVSVLILSAGTSGRMKREKALLPYGNGLTFFGQLIKIYTGFGCEPIIMVVNEQFKPSNPDAGRVEYVLNEHTEWGRTYSIQLGLQKMSLVPACFLQNIDNPFVSPELLRQMHAGIRPEGYVVPVYKGKGGHPILLGRQLMDHLRNREKIPDLRDALKAFKRIDIPFDDERIHLNINTPEDYNSFLKIIL